MLDKNGVELKKGMRIKVDDGRFFYIKDVTARELTVSRGKGNSKKQHKLKVQSRIPTNPIQNIEVVEDVR